MNKKNLVSFAHSARQASLLLATAPILLYQKTLSFDHGPLKALYPYGYCPFYPSCSEYCRLSIMRDGLIVGLVKGSYRILRCHPLTEGGVDLP